MTEAHLQWLLKSTPNLERHRLLCALRRCRVTGREFSQSAVIGRLWHLSIGDGARQTVTHRQGTFVSVFVSSCVFQSRSTGLTKQARAGFKPDAARGGNHDAGMAASSFGTDAVYFALLQVDGARHVWHSGWEDLSVGNASRIDRGMPFADED